MREEWGIGEGEGESREFVHALLGYDTNGEACNVDSVQVREGATALG
jgi:hypothetical protein